LNQLLRPNLVALLAQVGGTSLLVAFSIVLYRTTRSRALGYWTLAWVSLCLAVTTLWAGLASVWAPGPALFAYLFGEYLFGYLLLAGCWFYVGAVSPSRRDLLLIIPGAVLAYWLPRATGAGFNLLCIVHTVVYGAFFLMALQVLRSATATSGRLQGLRLMQTALALLAFDYFQFAPVFALSLVRSARVTAYWQYLPLYDLFFQMMLMFGMVMAVTGDIRHDLEVANRNLAQARDNFAAMAQIDHLTSALNRHVFHSLVHSRQGPERTRVSGCVAMIDVDDLKAVNDRYGHAAGDAAIRAVASAIRACIRADDLLFRWGGDEFLVVLFGVTEAEARTRFDGLASRLTCTSLSGASAAIDLSAAVGVAPFAEATSFDEVIALADTMMYGAKRRQLMT
jgi:diguanylate cyclase (GGDEF)-like protein